MSEAGARARRGWRVRRVRAGEGEPLRALRLEALAEAPMAFGSTYEDTAAMARTEWAERARQQAAGRERATFVVERDDGSWAGMATSLADGHPDAWLVSVFVAPDLRGSGAAEALLGTVLDWSGHEAGARVARLHVHEHNPRARRLYDRLGFRPTGRTKDHALGDGTEVEMELDLRGWDVAGL